MSFLGSLFGKRESRESRETLAKELLTWDKKNLLTRTDIPRPLALAIADTLALVLSDSNSRLKLIKSVNPEYEGSGDLQDLKSGDILGYVLAFYRINAISKDRKSRQEFVSAIQETTFESDERLKRFEKLFGDLGAK